MKALDGTYFALVWVDGQWCRILPPQIYLGKKADLIIIDDVEDKKMSIYHGRVAFNKNVRMNCEFFDLDVEAENEDEAMDLLALKAEKLVEDGEEPDECYEDDYSFEDFEVYDVTCDATEYFVKLTVTISTPTSEKESFVDELVSLMQGYAGGADQCVIGVEVDNIEEV